MGYVRLLQSIAAAERRHEREQLRRQREAEKAYQRALKAQAAEAAALEVEAFEAAIETLRSLHREATPSVNWQMHAQASEPQPRPRRPVDRTASAALEYHLENYRQTFWEWLTRSHRRRAQLAQSLANARLAEEHAAAEAETRAQHEHRDAVFAWAQRREFALKILAGDATAYDEAIHGLGGFHELAGFIGSRSIGFTFSPERTTVAFIVPEATVIPGEQKTLSSKGVSRKKFPDGKRMDLYQDFVCGAALRAAREVLAVLPVDGALVNVTGTLLNTATGHFEQALVLSVFCPRQKLEGVAWDHADASDCVQSLLHSMRFRKNVGFAAVTPVTPTGGG